MAINSRIIPTPALKRKFYVVAKEPLSAELILHSIMYITPQPVFWKDTESIFRGCNQAFASLVGFNDPDEIIGLTDNDLNWQPGGKTAGYFQSTDQQVFQGEKIINLEQNIVLPTGKKITVLTNKIPIYDNNAVVGALVMAVDITEEKQREHELKIQKKKAEAANLAKTEFLQNMSHDVKTPLSGIIGCSELLTRYLPNEMQEYSNAIHQSGKKLMDFFDSCIELSKMETGGIPTIKETFSLSELAASIKALFLPATIQKGLTFTVEQDPDIADLLIGDHANLYRIILNLIGNAIKFTDTGGVSLKIKLVKNLQENKLRLKVIVQDSGVGIAKKEQKVIFEKLKRLTPSYQGIYEGSGVGLYLVDQYVKSMKGHITLQSAPGEGSCFCIELPFLISDATKNPQPDLTATSYEPANPPLSTNMGCLVLLVEDVKMMQTIGKNLLEALHYRVDVAASAQEALELYEPEKYALIFMDIGLPGDDGFVATKKIRAIEQESDQAATPIIALSAHTENELSSECANVGMQEVMTKPLSLAKARRVLSEYAINQTDAKTLSTSSIDLEASVAVVGSSKIAQQMLKQFFAEVETVEKELDQIFTREDDCALRAVLHQLLGMLCYVIVPSFHKSVTSLQKATKEKSNNQNDCYQQLLKEIELFKKSYLSLKI
jgi:two-component system, OmpR family, aerobic respiration control sensor histidine kinase ArcB